MILRREDIKEKCNKVLDSTTSNYDKSKFTISKSRQASKISSKAGDINFVYAKTGVRVAIPIRIYEELASPSKVQVSFSDDVLAISEELPDAKEKYKVNIQGKKALIYSTKLVKEIIYFYELDFKNRTSITFSGVEYIYDEEYPIALFAIK